mmetsp:Transcript_52263/g.125167  ORF Transcript_52263/g.125167 Transcript_52263/m.125167 type:complete len:623 (-) Transcript_52263:257-2125(-)
MDACRKVAHMGHQLNAVQGLPHPRVGELVEGVHVESPCALKHRGVLWHQAHNLPKGRETHLRGVTASDPDDALPWLQDAEQAQQDRRLSAARLPSEATSTSWNNVHGDAVQNWLGIAVACNKVGDVDAHAVHVRGAPENQVQGIRRLAELLHHGFNGLRRAVHGDDVESLEALQLGALGRQIQQDPAWLQPQAPATRAPSEERNAVAVDPAILLCELTQVRSVHPHLPFDHWVLIHVQRSLLRHVAVAQNALDRIHHKDQRRDAKGHVVKLHHLGEGQRDDCCEGSQRHARPHSTDGKEARQRAKGEEDPGLCPGSAHGVHEGPGPHCGVNLTMIPGDEVFDHVVRSDGHGRPHGHGLDVLQVRQYVLAVGHQGDGGVGVEADEVPHDAVERHGRQNQRPRNHSEGPELRHDDVSSRAEHARENPRHLHVDGANIARQPVDQAPNRLLVEEEVDGRSEQGPQRVQVDRRGRSVGGIRRLRCDGEGQERAEGAREGQQPHEEAVVGVGVSHLGVDPAADDQGLGDFHDLAAEGEEKEQPDLDIAGTADPGVNSLPGDFFVLFLVAEVDLVISALGGRGWRVSLWLLSSGARARLLLGLGLQLLEGLGLQDLGRRPILNHLTGL